jgi:hypothetical protein
MRVAVLLAQARQGVRKVADLGEILIKRGRARVARHPKPLNRRPAERASRVFDYSLHRLGHPDPNPVQFRSTFRTTPKIAQGLIVAAPQRTTHNRHYGETANRSALVIQPQIVPALPQTVASERVVRSAERR